MRVNEFRQFRGRIIVVVEVTFVNARSLPRILKRGFTSTYTWAMLPRPICCVVAIRNSS